MGGIDDVFRQEQDPKDKKIATLMKAIDTLTAARVLTCVYCGHEYQQGTNPSVVCPEAPENDKGKCYCDGQTCVAAAAVLTEHIKACEKHPMRKLENDLVLMTAERDGLGSQLLDVQQDCVNQRALNERIRATIPALERRITEIGEMLKAREGERQDLLAKANRSDWLAATLDELGRKNLDLEIEITNIALEATHMSLEEATAKELKFTESEVRAAVRKLWAASDEKQQAIIALERRVVEQRRQLGFKEQAIAERNLALDALHWVWCSGGCPTGAHRFGGQEPISEEHIKIAETNTKRLRTWFEANQHRKAREAKGD